MNTQMAANSLANLGPLAQLQAGRLLERLSRLVLGLALYGVSIAMLVRAQVGTAPWDVFHQGAARLLPLSLGMMIIVTAGLVLLAWIPLRQMPGVGTVANALLIGPFADLGLAFVPAPEHLAARLALMTTGVVACGVASALYLGAQLGPGPRDGLMTGIARRTGWSIRVVRTLLEATVLVAGLVLGGTVGVGTLAFALAIGPLTQLFMRYFVVPLRNHTPINTGATT